MDRRTLLFAALMSFALIGVNTYFENQRMEEIKAFKETQKKEESGTEAPPIVQAEEPVYVLENEFFQLVFSPVGGAIKEINLPFKSETHPTSVVRPIAFDRQMMENDPQNAQFPNGPFYRPSEKGEVLHETGTLGGYYPLLRRDLITRKERKRIDHAFYALNLNAEFAEVSTLRYDVTHFDSHSISFKAEQPHRTITKRYFFEDPPKDGPYCFHLEMKIEGEKRGLYLTSGIPEVEWISGGPAPALKYRLQRGTEGEVTQIDLPKDSVRNASVSPDWVANSNGFLGLILNPTKEQSEGYKAQAVSGQIVQTRLLEIDPHLQKFEAAKLPGYQFLLPIPEKVETTHLKVFAGPFSDTILRTVDKIYSDPETGYTSDYVLSQSYHGWFSFISEPFAKFLMILLNFFYGITDNWAFSIILLTIALRIILYPLNAKSFQSTLKMQQIAPQVKAIQEKHKKDPRKGQVEMMNLYKEKGVNPFSGCFMMLIQMPFLIGMFDLLKSTFELRGAPFIPGWIDNLTAPDVLFSWNFSIVFIGNQFHLLPVLLGGVMFLQSRIMSPLPEDPSQWTEQQRQQRTMGTMMTAVFTLMFYHFPSGLNLYWLSSMLLGILQQWWTMRRMTLKPAPATLKK